MTTPPNTIEATIQNLENAWRVLFPTIPGPGSRQWAEWIVLHGAARVRLGIAKLSTRYARSPDEFQTTGNLVRFAGTIMYRLSRENPTNH